MLTKANAQTLELSEYSKCGSFASLVYVNFLNSAVYAARSEVKDLKFVRGQYDNSESCRQWFFPCFGSGFCHTLSGGWWAGRLSSSLPQFPQF